MTAVYRAVRRFGRLRAGPLHKLAAQLYKAHGCRIAAQASMCVCAFLRVQTDLKWCADQVRDHL